MQHSRENEGQLGTNEKSWTEFQLIVKTVCYLFIIEKLSFISKICPKIALKRITVVEKTLSIGLLSALQYQYTRVFNSISLTKYYKTNTVCIR